MDFKADEPPVAQRDADSADRSAELSDAANKEERLEFVKQAIAFTEWTIRAFDTKAQISIAAFVLSRMR